MIFLGRVFCTSRKLRVEICRTGPVVHFLSSSISFCTYLSPPLSPCSKSKERRREGEKLISQGRSPTGTWGGRRGEEKESGASFGPHSRQGLSARGEGGEGEPRYSKEEEEEEEAHLDFAAA